MDSRRDFLKKAGILSSLAVSLPTLVNANATAEAFNMCGYAAPKIDKVRVAVIGLGMRGPGAVERLSFIEGCEIVALCDKHPNGLRKHRKFLLQKV
jgi:threonine dehydrogenase-like Zn-dependent dehydrogenase